MTTGEPVARPRLLAANPRLSQWLRIEPDGTVILRMGKVELGQGILTALAQIAADELDVDLDAIRVVAANTVDGPDLGGTSGSMSVADAGAALRMVCATVRALSAAEGVGMADLDLDRDVLDDAPVKTPASCGWSAPARRGSTCRTNSPAGRASSTT